MTNQTLESPSKAELVIAYYEKCHEEIDDIVKAGIVVNDVDYTATMNYIKGLRGMRKTFKELIDIAHTARTIGNEETISEMFADILDPDGIF